MIKKDFVFDDWERRRTFKEWFEKATPKQRDTLENSGMNIKYYVSLKRDMGWSEFNRLVGRAVKMINARCVAIKELIKLKEKQEGENT